MRTMNRKYEVKIFNKEFMSWEKLKEFDKLEDAKRFYAEKKMEFLKDEDDTLISMFTVGV